jgi:hypothetical protein
VYDQSFERMTGVPPALAPLLNAGETWWRTVVPPQKERDQK